MNSFIRFNLVFLLIIHCCVSVWADEPLSDNEFEQLLLCYKHKIDAEQSGKEKYRVAFSNFDTNNLYKLFIDKKRLANPKAEEQGVPPHLLFDVSEPGYYESMMEAFRILPEYIGSPISKELIRVLHDKAVSKTKDKKEGISVGEYFYAVPLATMEEEAPEELFSSMTVFQLDIFLKKLAGTPNINTEELREENSKQKYELHKIIEAAQMDFIAFGKFTELKEDKEKEKEKALRFVGNAFPGSNNNEEGLFNRLNPMIEHYYLSLSQTKTLLGRIGAITELLRAFEVAHFLPDANGRVYEVLLLSKLLIENGLPPALLDVQGFDDGRFSVATMTKEVKQGIRNFLNENVDKQRSLIQAECGQFSEPLNRVWISEESDYRPFFKKKLADKIMKKLKSSLMVSLDQAIKQGELNRAIPEYEIMPLNLAIYLNSQELIDSLLKAGASPFGGNNSDNLAPLELALSMKNVKLAMVLLQQTTDSIMKSAPPKAIDKIVTKIFMSDLLDKTHFQATDSERLLNMLLAAQKDKNAISDHTRSILAAWVTTAYPKRSEIRQAILEKFM